MRVNKDAIRAICCKHWGKWPSEYEERRRRGEVTVRQVVAQCSLEMLASPLSAQAFIEWLMPGMDEKKREKKHQQQNNSTFEYLKRKRDGRKAASNSTS